MIVSSRGKGRHKSGSFNGTGDGAADATSKRERTGGKVPGLHAMSKIDIDQGGPSTFPKLVRIPPAYAAISSFVENWPTVQMSTASQLPGSPRALSEARAGKMRSRAGCGCALSMLRLEGSCLRVRQMRAIQIQMRERGEIEM